MKLSDKELLAELEKTKKELENLKQSFATVQEKFESNKSEIKADNGQEMTVQNCMDYMRGYSNYMDQRIGYIYEMISSVRQMVYQASDSFYSYTYKHGQNHVPPLTASQMEKLLERLERLNIGRQVFILDIFNLM